MGADYKKANRIAFTVGSNLDVPANTATFLGCIIHLGNEQDIVFRAPITGVIERLFAHAAGPPGVDENFTYHIRVNAANTVVTCVTAGAVAHTSEDLANLIAVTEGDEICVGLVTSLNAAAQRHVCAFILRH